MSNNKPTLDRLLSDCCNDRQYQSRASLDHLLTCAVVVRFVDYYFCTFIIRSFRLQLVLSLSLSLSRKHCFFYSLSLSLSLARACSLCLCAACSLSLSLILYQHQLSVY
jgi:hypothetical protein